MDRMRRQWDNLEARRPSAVRAAGLVTAHIASAASNALPSQRRNAAPCTEARSGWSAAAGGFRDVPPNHVVDLHRASPIACSRCFGSFFRHLASNGRAPPAAGSACQSGSLLTTATIVSVTSSPLNADTPVSISKSTQPNAQISARVSTALPLRLLGAHVRRRAENHPAHSSCAGDVMVGDLRRPSGARPRRRAPVGLRQAEVEDLHRAVRSEP